MTTTETILLRRLGVQEYLPTWEAMREFTDRRGAATPDELWLVEHPPVFTQGRNGDAAHLLAPGDIPVVPVDRGGQVTYHGPGQMVLYTLIDLRRRNRGVRWLVSALEQAVVGMLGESGIEAAARADAPGVYTGGRKIASLGLRVRRGAGYHGLALNVNMDLSPFERINPCGLEGMEMAQTADLGGPTTVDAAADALLPHLIQALELTGWMEDSDYRAAG